MLMVKKIVLSIFAVLSVCAFAVAQNKQVSGTVTDLEGKPVVGATVVVDGTSVGTSTNAEGKFSFLAPAQGVVVVSFIGCDDERVAINGKTQLNIVLKESSKAINDIIVVAFGEAKKEAFTGSAKVVEADDLVKVQSSNVTDALVGKVAGMQTTAASGRPGSGQSLTIRGVGSISAGLDPLWIVDGMPYEGDINNINTADIESISVLKDAASNALYGARGANGVIMVTTKRAKAGDAVVNFDGKWGVNMKALQQYDVVKDPGEYYELYYKSLNNYYMNSQGMSAASANMKANNVMLSNQAGGLGYNVMSYPAGQNLIGINGKLNPLASVGRVVTNMDGESFYLQPDNWLDELYRKSFRQEYNVSVAGSTDRANFYASLGYLNNEGIIAGSKNERWTARLRADYQAKKWLKVGGNMSYAHFNWYNGNSPDDEGDSDGGNAFAEAVRTAPIYPVYVRDGFGNIMRDQYGFKIYDFGDGRNGGAVRTNGGTSNSLQDIELNKYVSEGNAFSGQGFADFNLYKGLKLTVNGGVTVDETRSTQMMNPYYGQFATSGGILYKSHGRSIAYNLQQLLSYNTTVADRHNIDVLVGHEMYNNKSYGLYANKSVMFSYDNLELNGAVVDSAKSGSSISEYNNEGYFLRAQYNFDEKVFVSGSYRRDASSNFHPDNRWGNFWSLGAAWIISKENFMAGTASWLDMLKIKASYGSQGNDNIGSFLYTDIYSVENDGNGGVSVIWSRKGNKDITWETNTNLNVGLEFSLFKGRLSGGVDFFNRKTTDMLFALPVAPSLGYSSYYTNIGDMVNRGVEIELNADLIRTKNFTWDFSINMTHYKNKLVRLPEEFKTDEIDGHIGYKDGSYFRGIGLPFYTFYIPTYMGVDEATGESMWYSGEKDEDGNKIPTTQYSVASQNGRELQGNSTPKLYGGFNTSMRFYGVDLSVAFTYQIGGKVYDSGYAYYMSSPQGTSTGYNLHKDLFKAWNGSTVTETNIPRFQYDDLYTTSTSSRFLTDASYLNIQNITVGYTLPVNISKKFLVQKLRIYLACDNVWYTSKRQGLDPRQSISGGSNMYYYAPIRTISGGVSVTF